ncbi:MAG: DUF3604 domain-containing protein [Deltaproteobacteria bacterium]|nr:DUF3604 domain-containing protein [Deltaproteobacteria bacterium]
MSFNGEVGPSVARAFLALVIGYALSIATPAAAEKQLLWGDTHVHTSNSFDAYLNLNMTADPDTAYRFAKGLPVVHPGNRARVQLETPLDFLVVADHAEYLGVVRYIRERGIPRDELGILESLGAWAGEWWLDRVIDNDEGRAAFSSLLPKTNDVSTEAAEPIRVPVPAAEAMTRTIWEEMIETADIHNEPGRFTTLIGWEWSSIPAGANLHRVVFTSADAGVAGKFLPYASTISKYPEDLWKWLDETAAETGADFTSIPHNSNISKGYMFPSNDRLRGTPIDEAWVKQRAKWETVAEVTQYKGDSETHPSVSPDDPFADFETYPHYIQQHAPEYDPRPGDFIRSALLMGLAIEERIGFNPYRFGLIGSTDSHTGLATAEEPNFWGKFARDSTPEKKTGDRSRAKGPNGWSMSASGLAAVWAEENTRDAILRAFKRREVYATTGPRIAVRLFGGPGIKPGDEAARDVAGVGRAGGVPMGGELSSLTSPPGFLIHVAKDPEGANLDRVQMVKGWIEAGVTHETVHDVAWSGVRTMDSQGRPASIPDTVDPATATYSNEYGAATFATVWTDPDFDPQIRCFYYLRVLEIPTPRHSLRDAIALGIDPKETGHPVSIQERAYTSPIQYRPQPSRGKAK